MQQSKVSAAWLRDLWAPAYCAGAVQQCHLPVPRPKVNAVTAENFVPTEADAIRARAQRCRDFARDYAADVGSSLKELAAELEKQADRLDARRKNSE
jgi:hypothetical protein